MEEKNKIRTPKIPNENIEKVVESNDSFDEIWNKALEEVEDIEIAEAIKFIEEEKEDERKEKEDERREKEFIKKYGKEPEARTPDGKVNEKYIDYVLNRDFGLEPDSDNYDRYSNFSWGGLTGEEAYIAKWNCD